jgi:hypothetical protein
MNMQQWWKYTDRGTEELGEKSCPSIILSTSNPTWTHPGTLLLLYIVYMKHTEVEMTVWNFIREEPTSKIRYVSRYLD